MTSTLEPATPPQTPEVGAVVLDTAAGRLAEFRGVADGLWRVRLLSGEGEWEARPGDVWVVEPAGPPRPGLTAASPDACEECDAWWWAERLALDAGELSEAVDCRLYLRRHWYAAHGGALSGYSSAKPH